MIHLLYTNSDLIEGKGSSVLLAVSKDLNYLKKLVEHIPLSMGAHHPQAEIVSYKDAMRATSAERMKDLNCHLPEKRIHRFAGSAKWFDSFADYQDHMQNYR